MNERPEISLAEQSIVGAILIEPKCLGDVLTQVKPADFSSAPLRELLEAARDLYLANKPVDVVTVSDAAGGGELRRIAIECMETTPTAANVSAYCSIVREQAALARIRRAGRELQELTDPDEARDVLARVQGELTDRPGIRTVSLAAVMADFLTRMAQPKPDYVRWGLGFMDAMLHTGPGSYTIVAARPSTGKTALALQLALNIAQTKRVGFYSLETTPEILADRIAAATLDITLPQIKDHTRSGAADLQVLAAQMGSAEELRGDLDLVSASSMTVADIRAMSLARRHEVVIIDYVQLVKPTIRGERTAQMQQVSMDLRAMAQMTGVVIIALAQLRRPDSQQKQKAATMNDLKESGQFEQDADSILLMYHDEPGNRASDRWIKIEKNKEGYVGFRARYAFDGKKQRFTAVNSDGSAIEAKGLQDLPDDQMDMEDIEWK